MGIRKYLESLINCKAEERGISLTSEELRNAVNGVQFWFDETVYDSIDTALNIVEYDRKKE